MLTSVEDVVPYLLSRGLLAPEAVVEGEVAVVDVSRRNRVFQVDCREGPGFLVKQGATAEGRATVAREAAVYELLAGAENLRPYLPACHGYDAEAATLTLELLRGVRDLEAYHARLGRFPRRVGELLGEALARLHSLRLPAGTGSRLSERAPWVLSAHEPRLEFIDDLSGACLEVVRILQQHEFAGHLDVLRRDWSWDAFVHFDLRWDNLLVLAGRRRARLRIIDWELAGPGDACWDVASLFGAYLRFWVLSMPVADGLSPEQLPGFARFPLASMQSAMRLFWLAYARGRGFAPEEARHVLRRATLYTAARLIEVAWSQSQLATRLSSPAALLLQLSLNIFLRPEEAATHLLGIPLADAVWS